MNRNDSLHPHDPAFDPGPSPEEIVLDILEGEGMTPMLLMSALGNRYPGLSLGEVAKAINTLTEDGLIETVDTPQLGRVMRWTERQKKVSGGAE